MVTAKNSPSTTTTTTKRDHEAVVAGNAHHDARWLIEDSLRTNQCVLTAKGVENIANHKYVPGHYTHLDNICNPMWTYLTELLLPLWIAPNMVTTLGGLHCAISYLVVRTLCKDYNESVPNWVILLCAYCTFAYYTLDCMDGKQARRTQQSSPLGQLFDHGFDCVCNLSHISNVACFTLMCAGEDSSWLFFIQGSLQYSFFMAQWEEYYTGILPHAAGNYCGVTEVNYGLALLTLSNVFIDRENFWKRPLQDVFPSSVISFVMDNIPAFEFLPSLQLKHFGVLLWATMIGCLVMGSIWRVFTYLKSYKLRLAAVSKLAMPLLLAGSPFILPSEIRKLDVRLLSEALGLLFFLLTKKMIVFSMAKMPFASIQLPPVPYLLVLGWIRLDYYHPNVIPMPSSLLLLRVICFYHLYLELSWCRKAIRQICARLDINCFTIKHKKV